VEAELQRLLDQHADRRLINGCQAVVRNGHFSKRTVQAGIGDLRGSEVGFNSALLPPYPKRTRHVEARPRVPCRRLKFILGAAERHIKALTSMIEDRGSEVLAESAAFDILEAIVDLELELISFSCLLTAVVSSERASTA
jgi:hypothetical protein